MFYGNRLKVARQRSGLTKATLAEKVGVAARAVTGFESGEYEPTPETLTRISSVLGYSADFFVAGELELIGVESVSFRSLSKMTAKQRDAATAAASLAYLVSEWADSSYNLPKADIPDFVGLSPSVAAASLRQLWGLGLAPVGNVLNLVESRGVRVFSLMESGNEVDAYSVWRGIRPFIFLNARKSSERRRFDLAHELGHLILHRHASVVGDREREANEFAGAFLMPEESLRATGRIPLNLDGLIQLKAIWNVSLSSLLYRLREVGLVTYYNFNRLFVELSALGYRTTEPATAAFEQSQIWRQILADALTRTRSFDALARELSLPSSELSKLLVGLATVPISSQPIGSSESARGSLRVVK